ncbi:hypothetical protein ScPMuIL_002085 [Solemya velum]
MASTKYAIIQWNDSFTNLLNLENVKIPRKPVNEYKEGDYITANYGKRPYRARISEISGDRTVLLNKKEKNGSFPLKFSYNRMEDPELIEITQEAGEDRNHNDNTLDQTDIQLPGEEDAQVTLGADLDLPAPPANDDVEMSVPVTIGKDVQGPDNTLDQTDIQLPGEEDAQVTLGADLDLPAPPANDDVEMSVPVTIGKDVQDPEDEMPRLLPSPASSKSSNARLERRVQSLEKEVKELRHSLRSLKRKFQELASDRPRKDSTSIENQAAEPASAAASNDPARLSVDDLLKSVQHIQCSTDKHTNDCLRCISLKVFSRQDLVQCSRTGKKTVWSPGEQPRPALDSEKFKLVEQAVMMKCSITVDVFKKKFDNLVKIERRANKSKSGN